MAFEIRKATMQDIDDIADVISASVRGLGRPYYSDRQIELSIRSVFGVDTDLINDGTYFVAEIEHKIVGCDGWSRRKTLYGASVYAESRDDELLDPAIDAAKIRAFFVHPDAARQGIGRAILDRCEEEAKRSGFRSAEMMATLPGVPLYSVCGYAGDEKVDVPFGEGESIVCVRMSKQL